MAKIDATECMTLIFGSVSGRAPAELSTDAVFLRLHERKLKENTVLAIDMALTQHIAFQESQGKRGEGLIAQVREDFKKKLDTLLAEEPDFLELQPAEP